MKPVYLHYLDRELAGSLNVEINTELIEKITATLLITTNAALYSSLSTIFETCTKNTEHFLRMLNLVLSGIINVISHHPSIIEFIESRKIIYKHDIARYPMYFEFDPDRINGIERASILHKESSTTATLYTNLRSFSEQSDFDATTPIITTSVSSTDIISTLSRGLECLGDRAITWAAFSKYPKKKTTEFAIRKLISYHYTSHYMDYICADITTGIRPLNFYDTLSHSFPLIDYPILKKILFSFLPPDIKGHLLQDPYVNRLINYRGQSIHIKLSKKIQALMRAIQLLGHDQHGAPLERARINIQGRINNIFINKEPVVNQDAHIWYLEVNNRMDEIIEKFSKESSHNKHTLDVALKYEEEEVTKVLICTSTKLEMAILAKFIKEHRINAIVKHDEQLVYHSFGEHYGVELFAVKTQMGSGSAGGSAFTIDDAIRLLRPDFVIAIGIAFGADPEKQKIGDVLISTQVQSYELQRVGEEKIISRGDKASANPGLVARCEAAAMTWTRSDIHCGLVLSGEKLVDSKEFKKQLMDKEPEAIGGEMEAAGLVAACTRRSVPWVIMKGICDWGENKGDKDQELACTNAFDLFFHLLKSYTWQGFN